MYPGFKWGFGRRGAASSALIVATILLTQSGSSADTAVARQVAEARLLAVVDGNLLAAVSTLRPLLAVATGSLKAQAADELGDALDLLGRQGQAQQAYQTALRADPQDARAARNLARLGGLELPSGAPGNSLADAGGGLYQSAAPAAPSTAAGWEALLPPADRGLFRSQVEAFARSKAARLLTTQADHLWKAKEYDRSLAVYNQAVSQFPESFKMPELLDIAERAMQRKSPASAATAFKEAANRTSSVLAPWARFRLGEAQLAQDLMQDARATFTAVLKVGVTARNPSGKPLAIAAEIHVREIKGLKTWRECQQAQALFKQGQEALYLRRDVPLAESIFRKVSEDYPHSNYDGRALIQLASIAWYEHSQATTALGLIDQVLGDDRRLDLWPDGMRAGAWALYTKGRIHEALNDKPSARSAYHRLLSEFPDGRDHDSRAFAAKVTQRLAIIGDSP